MELGDAPAHLAPTFRTAGWGIVCAGKPDAVAAAHREHVIAIDEGSHIMHFQIPESANLIG